MKCPKCGSKKLKAHCFSNLDYILDYYNNKWQLINPLIDKKYIRSDRPYIINCIKCYNEFYLDFMDIQIFQPNLNFKEITLDIDHTLIHGEIEKYTTMDADFQFKLDGLLYLIKKRPHLDQFINFLNSKFEKINIYTAATEAYASEVINRLGIKNIGFIKTRKDTFRMRPLSFEWELMKTMNNKLIIDDKPLVIHGYSNVIFKPKPFHYNDNDHDTELLHFQQNMERKKVKKVKDYKIFKTKISFFLRYFNIELKLNLSQIKKISNIQEITPEEMENYPISTSIRDSFYEIEGESCTIHIIDVNYNNYLKIIKIIKTKALTKDAWDALINNR